MLSRSLLSQLQQAGIPNATQELEEISNGAIPIAAAVTRRCRGEPLAHILGWQPFYHRRFVVNRSTLIPRSETECLMEYALDCCRKIPSATIVDCGTGCGAIAITLKAEIPSLNVIAVDISADALVVARRNAQETLVAIDFRVGNLLDPLGDKRIDGIIANLPYLPDTWKGNLQPELSFEPDTALYAGTDGLDTIRALIGQIASRPEPRPWLMLELLPQQIDLAKILLRKALDGVSKTLTDLSGTKRFIHWSS